MNLDKLGVCANLRTAIDIYLQLQETTGDRVKIRAAGRKVDELVDILQDIDRKERAA